MHSVANPVIVLIIYLNLYIGRCGGWELIENEEMEEQHRGEVVINN